MNMYETKQRTNSINLVLCIMTSNIYSFLPLQWALFMRYAKIFIKVKEF